MGIAQNKRRFELIVTLWEKLLRICQLGTFLYPIQNQIRNQQPLIKMTPISQIAENNQIYRS